MLFNKALRGGCGLSRVQGLMQPVLYLWSEQWQAGCGPLASLMHPFSLGCIVGKVWGRSCGWGTDASRDRQAGVYRLLCLGSAPPIVGGREALGAARVEGLQWPMAPAVSLREWGVAFPHSAGKAPAARQKSAFIGVVSSNQESSKINSFGGCHAPLNLSVLALEEVASTRPA